MKLISWKVNGIRVQQKGDPVTAIFTKEAPISVTYDIAIEKHD